MAKKEISYSEAMAEIDKITGFHRFERHVG